MKDLIDDLTKEQMIILISLIALIKKYPNQRVGQIIFNYICAKCPNNDPFFISDSELIEILAKEF